MAEAMVFKINPQTGQRERKKVTVGDPRAFEGGFQLETKPPTSSLEGTLTGSLGTRELPEETRGGLENFKGIMRLIQSDFQSRRPGPMDILKRFDEAGVPLSTASQVSGVSLAETGQRAADIEAQTKTVIGLVSEQEERRKEQEKTNLQFGQNFISKLAFERPEVFSQLSGKDFEDLKRGMVSDGLLKVMATTAPEGKPPSISEQLSAAEKGFTIKDGVIQRPITGNVDDISSTIKQIESGGDYSAKGRSGEFGAYQFMPQTWNQWSQEYAKSQGINQSLAMTPENQDAVAKFKINQWLGKGYSVEEIPLLWNMGEKGAPGQIKPIKSPPGFTGVPYDSGAYQQRFLDVLGKKTQLGALGPEQELEAANLAREIFGTIGARKEENVNKVRVLMQKGQTVNSIRDSLRYSGQSEKLTGSYRDAATSISIGLEPSKAGQFLDGVDRLLEGGKINATKELLKKQSLDSLPTEEAKTYRGKERLMVLVNSIENDLRQYESIGGNTGIFVGNVEKIAGAIGTLTDKNRAYLANKINIAIQQYRQAISGAAFTESESKEYRSVFPQINNIKELNSAKIQSLKDATNTELDFIYSQRMGSDSYNSIFKNTGEYSLILPNGNVATFPTKEQLDKFKSDHGL